MAQFWWSGSRYLCKRLQVCATDWGASRPCHTAVLFTQSRGPPLPPPSLHCTQGDSLPGKYVYFSLRASGLLLGSPKRQGDIFKCLSNLAKTATLQLNNDFSRATSSGPCPQGRWVFSAARSGHLCPKGIQLFYFCPSLTNLSYFKRSAVGSQFFLTQPSSLCGCRTAVRGGFLCVCMSEYALYSLGKSVEN